MTSTGPQEPPTDAAPAETAPEEQELVSVSDSRWRRLETAGFLALLFLAVFAWFRQSPLIYDSDSYYHLAVARLFAERGLVDQLPLRASELGDGFGDKELGLHLFLVPFVATLEPVLAAQLAVTVLWTAVLALLALLVRSLLAESAVSPRWAYLLPVLLPWLSSEFAWRLVRLRAELGALLLLLLSLHCVVRQRERWLVPLGFLFAWSYTAWHAYLGLFGLIFVWRLLVRDDRRLQILLYPTLGVFSGLALHPHFPHNLTIWVLQSFDYFQGKAANLDVGNEIQPHTTDLLLRIDGGLFLLALGLWLARRRAAVQLPSWSASTLAVDVWGWAAAVFWVLYLLMARFSIYAFPFGLLWLLSLLAANGGFERVSRLGRLRIPLALVLLVACLAAAPETTKQIGEYRFRNHPGPEQVRLRDREELARRIPDGAHVAARWQQTPLYLWWAPQGEYLNVLDPIFMARTYPEAFDAQWRVFHGQEPDTPLVLARDLDSSFIAFNPTAPVGSLYQRLENDPRMVKVWHGVNVLFRVQPGATESFVRDWSPVESVSAVGPPRLGAEVSADPWRALHAYVRLPQPEPALESRIECSVLATALRLDETSRFEFAPWDPVSLWRNGQLLLDVRTSPGAVLGRGLEFELPAGEHTLAVRRCAPEDPAAGFFLRRLDG